MPTMQDCTCVPVTIPIGYQTVGAGEVIVRKRYERRKVTDCPVHGHDDDAIPREDVTGEDTPPPEGQ